MEPVNGTENYKYQWNRYQELITLLLGPVPIDSETVPPVILFISKATFKKCNSKILCLRECSWLSEGTGLRAQLIKKASLAPGKITPNFGNKFG